MLTYEIGLPPSGKKDGFNLLYDGYFTIPYIIDTIQNSPASHQFTTQAKLNVWIGAIYEEEPIKYQYVLDGINIHQTPRGKSKVNITLCRRKSYQKTDIEDLFSIFDQVRPVDSHLDVRLPKKLTTPKSISKGSKVPQRKLNKEALFVQYDKNKNVSLLSAPTPIKSVP